MPNIGDAERKTQNRVVKFFREKLHYTYLGDLHDVDDNSNVIEEKLVANLEKRGYSSAVAKKAVSVSLGHERTEVTNIYLARK